MPQDVGLSVDGGRLRGDKDAKLTVSEYTDFQYPPVLSLAPWGTPLAFTSCADAPRAFALVAYV